ncbi:MAG: hypothetical protein H6900_10480 [Rhodobacter sp.]|uniref:hypothetical protein n=1 Tax=Pararhodobacter sp. TaxID=2127056 RepID=UPI001D3A2AC0|nr:hypothetical protein [Pararhodobacter sp.]MCB1344112.1 hypothetical protein [Paracoccaceae bacterium]MCC0073700.1 hypothetical protein [Rhodobacter sp.]HPD93156.1 hypothetical protein [Pararhodobacter sp.]
MTLAFRLALAALCLSAVPSLASAHASRGAAAAQRVTIPVACFRGPWHEIIWDRPEVRFTDALVAYGYSYAEAEAIGYRACRDPQGVDDPDYLAGVVREMLRSHPPR